MTPSAKASLNEIDVLRALEAHFSGDWGVVDDDDKKLNDLALQEGTRLLSAFYDRNGTKFWIITEADRSSTTVLLPGDY